jgi:hypothetical protein
VRQAHAVQRHERLFDIAVDPCLAAIIDLFGAGADDRTEIGVCRYPKPVLADGFCQRFGKMKAIEWQDRPMLRFDPESLFVIARVGHGEYAVRIGFQQQVYVDSHARS